MFCLYLRRQTAASLSFHPLYPLINTGHRTGHNSHKFKKSKLKNKMF